MTKTNWIVLGRPRIYMYLTKKVVIDSVVQACGMQCSCFFFQKKSSSSVDGGSSGDGNTVRSFFRVCAFFVVGDQKNRQGMKRKQITILYDNKKCLNYK